MMGGPGAPVMGGFRSTTASLDLAGWMVSHGNASVSLNQSLLWAEPGSNLSSSSSSSSQTVAREAMKEKNWPALLILVIILLTVGGNILVILAVSLEKKLQNATNFFLRSLAVADMLVGILVMPISLINILYDYAWPLPNALCPIWIYLDVLFSTASIMHLCAISLDRYVAIRNPIEHSRFNSRTKAMLKIAAVWTISIVISTPIPVIGLHNEDAVFVNGSCVLNEERFMLVGSFVAFFIPLVIMVVTYCLTVQVLQRQATVFLYEGNGSSQQPLQSPPAPPNAASRRGSPYCLTADAAARTPSSSVSVLPGSEAPSLLSSPAVGGGGGARDPAGSSRRGMMQAIKNERRASKVLGVVFFLFLVMWCPFFVTNVASVLCRRACRTPLLGELLNVFVWVGYVASGVNPLVYTLFNKTYRRAFSRYMRCRYRAGPAPPPPPGPSHAAALTPVLGKGGVCGGVDRNSNCRNGAGGGPWGGAEPEDADGGLEMAPGAAEAPCERTSSV